MDPNVLRGRLLQHIADHDAKGSKGFCTDEELSTATGESKADVQHQLDILEGERLVRHFKTFGPNGPNYSVELTPKGKLAVEQMNESQAPPKGPIGF